MEINMTLHLPRDAATVPVSRQVLDSCLQTLGVTPDTRADIALALGEACANVIQHAGPGEKYEVQVSAKNCRCAIEVVNTSSNGSSLLRGFCILHSDSWTKATSAPSPRMHFLLLWSNWARRISFSCVLSSEQLAHP